jgi:hypothetical protein
MGDLIMRFMLVGVLLALSVMLISACGGGDHSGRVDKSGAAGPQDPLLGDAPPPAEGPAAVEVRYTEQTDGVTARDIMLKADSSFIITLHGYAEKNAKEMTTQRWDTELKDMQTKAILEGCSYQILTGLRAAMFAPAHEGSIATIAVKFANGEEITVQASNHTPPPNDFRAIAYTLTELAQETVTDKTIKPVKVQT